MRRALLICFLLSAACRPRVPEIQKGSTVRLSYSMTADGAPVDSAEVRFVQGSGEMLPGLDEALLGLKAGDERTLTLPPEKGFGVLDPSKVETLPLSKFGAQAKLLKPGGTVAGRLGGKAAEARILRVDSHGVTLDFNHPRAGKTLGFKLKVLEVANP